MHRPDPTDPREQREKAPAPRPGLERAARHLAELSEALTAAQSRLGTLAAIRATRVWDPPEHDEYLELRARRSRLERRYTAAERHFDLHRQQSWTDR